MSLFFKVKNGDGANEVIRISAGLRIGRKDCDLTLRDPKVSSLHAKVEERPSGALWLVDQGSSNGILSEGRKTPEIELRAGMSLGIGPFLVEVLDEEQLEGGPELEEWRLRLIRLASQAERLSMRKNPPLSAFSPPFKIEEVGGSTSYLVGYGPRVAGNNTADLFFSFSRPNPVEFLISPDESGHPVFSTKLTDQVRVNDVSTASTPLKDGDIISTLGNRLRIRFLKPEK